jgi:hypothetical protein
MAKIGMHHDVAESKARPGARAKRLSCLAWAAVLFAGPLLADAASTDSTSCYAGSTWTCDVQGWTSIIVFKPGGDWTEDWDNMHWDGVWTTDPRTREVVVTRFDDFVLRYQLNADQNLVRDWRTITYRRCLHGPANPAPSYVGTTWTCDGVEGADSVIVFKPGGAWTEDWKNMHLRGVWRARLGNTEVVVNRTDHVVLHYKLDAEDNLVRDVDSITYRLAAWGATSPAENELPDSPVRQRPTSLPGID